MRVVDLGLAVPYAAGMERMRAAIARVDVDGAVLLLQEHTPVITTTRTGGTAFVHAPRERLLEDGIDLVETDRGGDVTFHGPGQLVGYPVLRLCDAGARADLGAYVRRLEGALVRACAQLGADDAHRVEGMTGVWVGDEKLVAIGVGVGGGVTRHGFALNMTTELDRYTRHITACGLVGRGVTSLARVLGRVPPREEIVDVVVDEVTCALGTQPPVMATQA